MTPVLNPKPKHQSKHSVGSLPASTRAGTPGGFKSAVPNTSVVLLNSTTCSSVVGNSPSTPLKGSGSGRGTSRQRTNSGALALTESEALLRQQQEVEARPFMKRVFVNTEQTSNAIHLSWLHPRGFKRKEERKEKESLRYVLEYGVGVRVNDEEQFRQIYRGPQHKCIITDLNPKTVYRFRVAPLLGSPAEAEGDAPQQQGEWSEILEVMTRDAIAVETRSMGKHARLANKYIVFER